MAGWGVESAGLLCSTAREMGSPVAVCFLLAVLVLGETWLHAERARATRKTYMRQWQASGRI